MLQISRRIEARLTLLGKCGKSKVMKFELEDARIILRISLPARAIDWHFFWNDAIILTYLSSDGE
jgi:hypothetical protein